MRGSSGYAIAEVLVAVVIISISFIELSGAISKIMRAANQTVLIGKSISVAHSTMEEVMAQSFDAKGSEAGGYALQFDGIDDYILLPEAIDIGSTSSTVSMWVKVPVVGEGSLIADERVGILLGIGRYSPKPNANWEINSAGQIRIHWNEAEIDFPGSSDLRDGKWHHIAFVRNIDNDSLK
ncbi:MAG: LamG-like jellyroll fold domain-containing protein, partial [Candidatus Neomarinimicrobiota bacterium]